MSLYVSIFSGKVKDSNLMLIIHRHLKGGPAILLAH